MKNLTGKKKWIIIGLAITLAVLLIAAVVLTILLGKNEPEPEPTTTVATTTEETTEETTVETTVETEPPVIHRNPLTGTPLEAPYTGRVAAVVVNNLKAALPQYGISQADILYEFETEGGVTRFLALFTDLSDVEQVGPIRSVRSYFNNIGAAFDAPVVHCGGSVTGRQGYYDYDNKLTSWEHIDQAYNGNYFFRDTDRYYYQGYNWEHTLFAKGPKLLEAFEKREINMVNEEGVDYGFAFDDVVALEGETAKTITATFLGTKTTTMTYDETAGKYMAEEYGSALIDGQTEQQVGFENVLVVLADQTKRTPGSKTLSYYDMIGEGDAYLAIDGKITQIKWSRATVEDPFVYTHADGTAVTFKVGTTYAAVIDTDGGSVKYE